MNEISTYGAVEQKIRDGTIVIISEQPDEATIEAYTAAGYSKTVLADGRLAWVPESEVPEMTDEDVADMVADLYDTDWQHNMFKKFFSKWGGNEQEP